jgi:hypothetical protein
MKISCPGCGKTYQVPQELIDAILADHRPKAADPEGTFFREIAAQPTSPKVAAQSASEPRPRRSVVKTSILIATIAWPTLSLCGAVVNYAGFFSSQDGQRATAAQHAASFFALFLISLLALLPIWLLIIAFLGVIWFATRR